MTDSCYVAVLQSVLELTYNNWGSDVEMTETLPQK